MQANLHAIRPWFEADLLPDRAIASLLWTTTFGEGRRHIGRTAFTNLFATIWKGWLIKRGVEMDKLNWRVSSWTRNRSKRLLALRQCRDWSVQSQWMRLFYCMDINYMRDIFGAGIFLEGVKILFKDNLLLVRMRLPEFYLWSMTNRNPFLCFNLIFFCVA